MRGAEVERILERYVAVDDLDRLDLNRPARPGSFLLARLALHERAEIPSPVRHLCPDDVRAREADAADHRPLIDQLADAVGERDLVDVDQRAPIAREADVAELQAAEEGSVEAPDRERGREIVVRLTDDQFTDAILPPARFDARDAEAEQDEGDCDETDQRLREPRRNGSETSEPCHLKEMVSTAVPDDASREGFRPRASSWAVASVAVGPDE